MIVDLPVFRLEDLPRRLRCKIADPDPNSADECWHWKGGMRKGKAELRACRPVPEKTYEGRPRGRPRTKDYYQTRARPLPMTHSPDMDYTVPAHREVMAVLTGKPYYHLPKLDRCTRCDDCVNPAHNTPMKGTGQPAPKTGRKAHHGPSKEQRRTMRLMSQEAIMQALQQARPSIYLSPRSAAEEAQCGVPTDATWMAYQAWDQSTPDAAEIDPFE